MEYAVVGWPEDGPQLRLDHREFRYAGKFVMSNTGKAVARDGVGEGNGREGDGGDGESDDDGRKSDEDRRGGNEDGREGDEGDDERDEDGREGELVAAVSFNEDRTDPATAWLRYVTVRDDRRGEGVGARLARFVTARLRERGYDRIKIAVNNPFAFHALYKAGFGYADERTGLAELVLASPGERSAERYRAGLDAFREREDLAPEERDFLAAKADEGPPDVVPVPG